MTYNLISVHDWAAGLNVNKRIYIVFIYVFICLYLSVNQYPLTRKSNNFKFTAV